MDWFLYDIGLRQEGVKLLFKISHYLQKMCAS